VKKLSVFIPGFIISVSFTQIQQPIDKIYWATNNPLTWDHFKGSPDTTREYAAATDCHIDMNYNSRKDTLYVRVETYSTTFDSWIKPKYKTIELLKHEQLHFDVAELFARKLRKTILELRIQKKDAQNALQAIEAANTNAYRKYQDLYDSETDHNLIKKKQEEWEKKITSELKAYEAYSNPDLRIILLK
jgi:hypothetical protein